MTPTMAITSSDRIALLTKTYLTPHTLEDVYAEGSLDEYARMIGVTSEALNDCAEAWGIVRTDKRWTLTSRGESK